MINIDNKIRNIYYMLCFSFNKDLLTQKDISSVGTESFDNIYNLFSIILCIMLKRQVKKGINRDYINVSNELQTLRGKINITESINTNSITNRKLICDYDEFNENNILNQIIKTTAYFLIKSNKIGNATKKELKKSMLFFNNVDVIQISSINWKNLMYNRNNKSYKHIMVLCELILKGLIVSDKKGKEQFNEFLDETALHRIYENFIREYFKKKGLNSSKKRFRLTEDENDIIGMAETDITLEDENNMLIIDAKFYSHILKEGRYPGSKIISMGNIYQINTYVDKQQFETHKKVKGMLLYAQTIDEEPIDTHTTIAGKEIKIKTLDMNKEWSEITKTLDSIKDNFLNGNI